MQRIMKNAEDTRAIGASLGRTARAGDVLWLHGELGAGKTELTKGIAEGLGCADPVSSPSFALIHEYHGGRLTLFHIDLYRLDAPAAMDLGLEEYVEDDGLTVLEWGERLPAYYFPDGLDLSLTDPEENDTRHLTLHPRGPAGQSWWERAFGADTNSPKCTGTSG